MGIAIGSASLPPLVSQAAVPLSAPVIAEITKTSLSAASATAAGFSIPILITTTVKTKIAAAAIVAAGVTAILIPAQTGTEQRSHESKPSRDTLVRQKTMSVIARDGETTPNPKKPADTLDSPEFRDATEIADQMIALMLLMDRMMGEMPTLIS